MIRLNLLPDIKRDYIRARRAEARVITLATLVSIAAIAGIVVLAIWVYGAQSLQKSLLNSSIEKKMVELKSKKDINKYVTIQNQLSQIDTLHDKKVILSRLFDITSKLNPKAPNNVTVSNLNIDTAAFTMQFEGRTSSYTGLETFRDTLKNAKLSYRAEGQTEQQTEPLFSAVIVESPSISKDPVTQATYVTFKISATYNPAAFANSTEAFLVSVPTIETTQSKQDAPDVFGAPQGGGQ